MMMTQNPAAGVAENAKSIANDLGRLTESLKYLQNVCSAMELNQSAAGREAMVTIAQAHTTLDKSAQVIVTMAALLELLAGFHALARQQMQSDPASQPAWLIKALSLLAQPQP